MAIRFYNTLGREKQEFKPINKKEVKLYICGPTVYNYAHIGNLRSYVFSDVLRRYLKYKGFKLTQVMNITDVDDKTIRDSQKEGISLKKFTEKYTKEFFEDFKTLNIEKPELITKATEHIDEMVALINKLLKKGYAYKGEDGSIYYSVKKFKSYGKFANLDMKNLKAGARVSQDEYEKNEVNDFALWKSYSDDDGKVFWEPVFLIDGKEEKIKGRPGWHIECSAMSSKYLGDTFDIHTGGVDLVFPHHQNEIAQSEGASGKKFVNYWLHCEHLLVDGTKMSKSKGSFYTLRDLLNLGMNPKAVRYLLMSVHYRQQLNFTLDGCKGAESSVGRMLEFMRTMRLNKNGEGEDVESEISKVKGKFDEALDDDLNLAEGLAAIFEFIREINKKKISRDDAERIYEIMTDFDKILGILEEDIVDISREDKMLIEEREEARKAKDFAKADKIRDELKSRGIIVEDSADGGIRWKRV